MADASAYGNWVDADDYRSWVGVTKTAETDTTVTVQVDAWMCVQYGWSTYGGDAVRGWAGIKDGSADWQWSAQVNLGTFSANTEWSYKKQSWTIQKGHSSKTVTGSAYISGHEGKYSGTVTEAKASITVAAKKSYTVKYNANGGSGAPSDQTKWHGETLKLSSTAPTRNGYTFQGWATSSTGAVAYAAGANYTANASATLYAVWKATSYTVSYNANGGTGAPSAQTKQRDVTLKLSTTKPTRSGYQFVDWNTQSGGGGTSYASGANYTANASATLYAQWTNVTYTVSYNANGGSGAPSQQTKQYGVDLTLRTGTPTRTGYTFKGWATSSTGAVAYAAGGTYKNNASVTLYAVWQIVSYSITYDANGGTGAPSAQSKNYGASVKLSSSKPSRTGYNFTGWNTQAGGGGTSYAAGATYSANANLKLYAQWSAITYQVKYNANGGSGAPAAQTKTYGVTLKLSTTKPTRAFYAFKGWATAAAATQAAYAAGANYTANAAVTLYAVWEYTYKKPTVTNLKAVRCLQDGTPDDTGTYCKVTARWALGTTTDGNSVQSIVVKVGSITRTLTPAGTSGTVSEVIGTVSIETSYKVSVTVTDVVSSASASTILSPAYFTLDFAAGGRGVGVGRAAPTTGMAIAMDTEIATTLKMRESNSVAPNIRFATANNDNANTQALIQAHDTGGSGGHDLTVRAGGNLVMGGGEYADNRMALGLRSLEEMYIGSDGGVLIESNAGTIANRKTWELTAGGTTVLPKGGGLREQLSEGVIGTSDQTLNCISITDADGEYVSQFRCGTGNSGKPFTALVARKGAGDTLVQKVFYIMLDGTQAVYQVPDAANFRSAINASGALTARKTQVTLPANTRSVSCTAPAVSGYTFVCWLAPSSSGFVQATYMVDPTSATTNCYLVGDLRSSASTINVSALYARTS